MPTRPIGSATERAETRVSAAKQATQRTSAPRGRETVALVLPVYVPTLLLSLGQNVVVATLPIFANRFTPAYALVSLAVAATSLGTMVADVPSGMLLERLGRRRMMLVGCWMIALASAGTFFVRGIPDLVAYQLVGGVGAAFWSISRLAYLTTTVPPSQRGRAISAFGGINRIGTFVGPGIGGFVGQHVSLATPFLITAACAAAAGGISFLYVTESARQGGAHAGMRWKVVGSVVRHNYKELGTAGSAQIFAQMIRAGRKIIVPLYATNVIHLDVGAVGAVYSVSAGIDMLLFIPAGYVMDRMGRKFASVPSFVIMAAGMGMIPFARDFTSLAIATIVIGLGNGLGSGTMMTLGADLAPKEGTGEFLGVWRLMGDSGSAGGPLVVGKIADVVGLSLGAIMLAAMGAIASVLLILFVKETLPGSLSPNPSPARGGET